MWENFLERVYKTITSADQSSILSSGQGNLSLFTNDVEIIIRGLEDIITVFGMSFFVLGALGILLWLTPILTLATISFITFSLFISLFLKCYLRRLGKNYSLFFQKHLVAAKNMLDGYSTFRLGRGSGFADIYKMIIRSYLQDTRKQFLKNVFVGLLTSFFANLPVIISLSLVGILTYYGYINIVTLFVINHYVISITNNLGDISRSVANILFTRGVFKKHKEMQKNYPPGRINSFSTIKIKL